MTPQPELKSVWDVPFYGRADTATGHLWWYEKDGKRYPLVPAHPSCESPALRRT